MALLVKECIPYMVNSVSFGKKIVLTSRSVVLVFCAFWQLRTSKKTQNLVGEKPQNKASACVVTKLEILRHKTLLRNMYCIRNKNRIRVIFVYVYVYTLSHFS